MQTCPLRGSGQGSKRRPSFCVLCSVASVSTGDNLQSLAVGALFASREGNKWIFFQCSCSPQTLCEELIVSYTFQHFRCDCAFLGGVTANFQYFRNKKYYACNIRKHMNGIDLCVSLRTKEIQQHFSLLPGLTVIAQSLNMKESHLKHWDNFPTPHLQIKSFQKEWERKHTQRTKFCSLKIYEKHLNSVHFKMDTYLLKEFHVCRAVQRI